MTEQPNPDAVVSFIKSYEESEGEKPTAEVIAEEFNKFSGSGAVLDYIFETPELVELLSEEE